MALTPADRQKIIAARTAVETYRTAHAALYTSGKTEAEIRQGHIDILNDLIASITASTGWDFKVFSDNSNLLRYLESIGQ